MLISTVVDCAEAVTGVLALALCLRIYLLYRAFCASMSPSVPQPAVVSQSATPRAILEDYIGELLGADNVINSLPESRVDEVACLVESNEESVRDMRLPPFNPQSYQPITAFLANRCEVQQAS